MRKSIFCDTVRRAFFVLASAFIGALAVAAEPAPGALSAAIRDKLEIQADKSIDFADREALRTFYGSRDYSAIWVDEAGPTRAARLAMEEIANAESWGLSGKDFATPALARPLIEDRWTTAEAADAEIEISALVLKYARQARGGRIIEPEKQLTTYLDRAPRLPDPAVVLTEATMAADPGAVLRSYQPRQDQFLKLKDYYARLLDERRRQKDLNIGVTGDALKPGATSPEIVVLRQRFGVPAIGGAEDVYDAPLQAAVKKFQESMSLRGDGVIGAKTRQALNVNVDDRIAAVVANMEEWRWMPDDLGATHIFVNAPSYSIDFVKDGAKTFSERVIVGKAATQTPIFSQEMTTVVLRPEWYLPDSIKLSKLMSGRALEGQGLKVKKNGRVVSSSQVNWGKANLSAYEIYQQAGDGNALGLVKFLFPNKHSVYLHDTPDKGLFNASERNFSHGCVRVRNPLTLAQHILDNEFGAGAMNAVALSRSGPYANEITLQKPIPVHIGYFTVWIGDDGKAQFFADAYGHQKRITLALADRWNEIDRGKDHLAAIDTDALKGLALRAKAAETLPNPAGLFGAPSSAYSGSRGSGVSDLIHRAFGGY